MVAGSSVSAFRFRVSVVELLKLRNVFAVDNFDVVNDDEGAREEEAERGLNRFDESDVVGLLVKVEELERR